MRHIQISLLLVLSLGFIGCGEDYSPLSQIEDSHDITYRANVEKEAPTTQSFDGFVNPYIEVAEPDTCRVSVECSCNARPTVAPFGFSTNQGGNDCDGGWATIESCELDCDNDNESWQLICPCVA